MSAPHTPGPWNVYSQPVANPAEAKKELAALVDGTQFSGTLWMIEARGLAPAVTGCGPTSEANARLIAAAPGLLAACEQARKWLCEYAIDSDPDRAGADIIEELGAAIKKARGQ